MKVYRGYDKRYSPLTFNNWIYVTPDVEQAKWYATKDGFVNNGGIIEYDMNKDNISWISLDKINSMAENDNERYTINDLLWYQEELANSLDGYVDGIYFTDPNNKNHTIYILLDEKYLQNPRELSKEEFDSIQLNESLILNEYENLSKWNRIAGFYHLDTEKFELFPRTTKDVEDPGANYTHNVHSKDEFTEFNIVRFGIEDIPGEGRVCYIEADTKRNAEKCYYSIVDEYQEDLGIEKFELEYYVGDKHKYSFYDRFGDLITESVKPVNKELADTKLITSAYELNTYLKNHTESRVVYDYEKKWFLVGNSETSIHVEMINDALLDGIYPSFEWKGKTYPNNSTNNSNGGSLLYEMHPNKFLLFRTSSDELNGEEYYYDRYKYCYVYKDYCVFDRNGDFDKTPLYKLLGEPIELNFIGDINEDEGLNETIDNQLSEVFRLAGVKE